MGHRANYAIRHQGEISLYYSQWGGISVPADVFWGPEHAERFIRQQEQVNPNDWQDDVWGEGGVALNLDEKRIVLFGGEALGHPPLQPVFLKLMQALWAQSGWTVEWAEVGMPAIAAGVGADPTLATAAPLPPTPIDLGLLGVEFIDEDGYFNLSCLISIEEPDGTYVHKVVDGPAIPMLANGDAFLTLLERLPEAHEFYDVWVKPPFFGEEHWSLGNDLSSSIIIHPQPKKLEFRELYSNRSAQAFLSNTWRDWELHQFVGTIEDHFKRLGLDTPAALQVEPDFVVSSSLDEDEIIQQVGVCLFGARVSPELLPSIEHDVINRSEIFGKALAAMLK